VSDAVEGGPILAYLQNGEPMSVREKGPLWVVYPYDLKAEYQTEVTFSRSIWQLVRLDLVAN
ncbi:MAG: oxidoreductase, partial [Tabrizicola sp.]